MYNWLKKSLIVGSLVLASFNVKGQTIESIVNRIHYNSQDTIELSLGQAIEKSLENDIAIKQRKLILSKDSINYKIQLNNQTKPKIRGTLNLGYNLKEGITDFKNTMAYPEAAVSFSIPVLNPDNKYTLKIYLNNIKEDNVNLLYDIANNIRFTTETYINILNLKNHIRTIDNELHLIDSILQKGDSAKLSIIKPDLLNLYQNELRNKQSIEQVIEGQKTILRKSFGTISTINIKLSDTLRLPDKNLFNDKNFDPKNISSYEDRLAAYATIIRTQVERIKIEDAILNYAKKKNIEYNIFMNANLRNSVVPAPYFGMPLNIGLSFNIFGNNYRLNRRLTKINIEIQELNIEKTILNIAPSVRNAYEDMLLHIQLANPKNKNLYLNQLKETTKLLFKKGPLNSHEQILLSKLPEIIKNNYLNIREYYDNVTIANKRAQDIRKFVLYSSQPREWAEFLEKHQLPRNLKRGAFKKTIRPELIRKYKIQKTDFKNSFQQYKNQQYKNRH